MFLKIFRTTILTILTLCLTLLPAVNAAAGDRTGWPFSGFFQNGDDETETETEAETEAGTIAETEAETKTSTSTNFEVEYLNLPDGSLKLIHFNVKIGKLKEFSVPEFINDAMVSAIDEGAFAGAVLEQLYLPYTVTDIAPGAFRDAKISSFKVSPDSPYAMIDGVLFEKSTRKLVAYPAGSVNTGYSVPDGILSIGECAFFACEKT